MLTPLLPFALPGFVVEYVSTAPPTLLIDARASTPEAVCPDCHTPSARVHSHYTRCLRDLPIAEHPVRLRIQVRRFRCATVDGKIKSPFAQRTWVSQRLPPAATVH
jgi:transposase